MTNFDCFHRILKPDNISLMSWLWGGHLKSQSEINEPLKNFTVVFEGVKSWWRPALHSAQLLYPGTSQSSGSAAWREVNLTHTHICNALPMRNLFVTGIHTYEGTNLKSKNDVLWFLTNLLWPEEWLTDLLRIPHLNIQCLKQLLLINF